MKIIEKKIELKTQLLSKSGEVLVDGNSTVIYDKL